MICPCLNISSSGSIDTESDSGRLCSKEMRSNLIVVIAGVIGCILVCIGIIFYTYGQLPAGVSLLAIGSLTLTLSVVIFSLQFWKYQPNYCRNIFVHTKLGIQSKVLEFQECREQLMLYLQELKEVDRELVSKENEIKKTESLVRFEKYELQVGFMPKLFRDIKKRYIAYYEPGGDKRLYKPITGRVDSKQVAQMVNEWWKEKPLIKRSKHLARIEMRSLDRYCQKMQELNLMLETSKVGIEDLKKKVELQEQLLKLTYTELVTRKAEIFQIDLAAGLAWDLDVPDIDAELGARTAKLIKVPPKKDLITPFYAGAIVEEEEDSVIENKVPELTENVLQRGRSLSGYSEDLLDGEILNIEEDQVDGSMGHHAIGSRSSSVSVGSYSYYDSDGETLDEVDRSSFLRPWDSRIL